ncbi:hypothetical protein TPHA_0C00700 [Tetrapisispora phaffii CBS 4417]|uniref:Assembly chaperone of RPL4 n=1 Tax=Tetrapisispora phaffii (strain ATCC 24235 / CBS 4417 / NBRC 1672 / NRRL Y-8282 / UCD 70-5) TaxID=1071381 RepID=G8BR50_TETPH|nr:hypothetical protein TPHA_0C00700 [Tetrapisispora phaffii CBS 4417]CCE62226.1 hypothetical protein TPHA_0C00700 [Tetrapisispora phaffii CBS 4417]
MSDMQDVIEKARELLGENNAKEALSVLKPLKKKLKNPNDSILPLMQIFIDVYLEKGDVEKAYPILSDACELDPTGSKGGSEKFFTFGQVTGGEDGIKIIYQGIENISQEAGESISEEQLNKIVGGLLSMIEIWMTDLCMEPNAESQCEELIQKAMEISENRSPETWSMLGSIRISQQRFSDASNAFIQAWEYFEIKKQNIEKSLASNAIASHREYIELLQPLLALAKMCIEMGLYEIALKIISAVKDIEEDNLENYYLEGFVHYLLCKVTQFKATKKDIEITAENIYEFNEHFEDIRIEINNPTLSDLINDSRIALTFVVKLGENVDKEDNVSQELVAGANKLLKELGGAVDINTLMRSKKGENVEEADLELDLEVEEDEN